MVSDEIVISDVPAAGWKVSFDRKPTKVHFNTCKVEIQFHDL